MPQVRVEKKKNELASLSLLEVCQIVTAPPYTLSFLSLVYCPDLQQQKEAHCPEVASPQEGTLPLFAPLKILETPSALLPLEILSLGEPLLHMGGATCFRCWDSTHTQKSGGRGERAQSIQSMVSISLCPQHLHFFWNLLQLDFTIQAHSSLLLICFHLKL